MKKIWKKGSGKIGVLGPLIGAWVAKSDTAMGRVKCTRTFSKFHGENWILLDADWDFGGKHYYKEYAIYGVDEAGQLAFWSFTSDAKKSQGFLADGADIHPEAIAFEAQMPAGLARMIYWPADGGGINLAVESKTKKGWNRFTHHQYSKVA
jgi:hypothetical protein